MISKRKRTFFLFCLPAVFTLAVKETVAVAENRSDVFTDKASAGADFGFQGEYAGSLEIEGQERQFGAQVVALGDGRFRIVGYEGGLPGDGWNRGDEQTELEASLVDGRVVGQVEVATIEIADDKLKVIAGDNEVGVLDKVNRMSPTLGKAPPENAIVLFDGSSIDAFENAKLVEGNYLGATNCYTKEKFGDHFLHIEFRTPFMPKARGQARGNSGVYLQSRYEVQVLDSFGLAGKDNECGGIYSISAPNLNMCFPPLSWQTYDIDFTAARYDDDGNKTASARVTIKHNGVVIHDDLELKHGTPGRFKEGPGPEALFLQDHGDPVVFRNIWVAPK